MSEAELKLVTDTKTCTMYTINSYQMMIANLKSSTPNSEMIWSIMRTLSVF